MTAVDLVASVTGRFPQAVARPSADHPAFTVPAAAVPEFLKFLRDEAGFDLLSDISGIDWGVDRSPRFAVAYHLLSTTRHDYVRVVADCPPGDPPAMPSATALWPAADWHEREAFDMFGIRFDGHPDLRRLLMWEGYPYHPLRKDFPLAGRDTVLPDEEVAAETGTPVQAAPMVGGPFVAPQKDYVSNREPRARDESWNEHKPKPPQG